MNLGKPGEEGQALCDENTSCPATHTQVVVGYREGKKRTSHAGGGDGGSRSSAPGRSRGGPLDPGAPRALALRGPRPGRCLGAPAGSPRCPPLPRCTLTPAQPQAPAAPSWLWHSVVRMVQRDWRQMAARRKWGALGRDERRAQCRLMSLHPEIALAYNPRWCSPLGSGGRLPQTTLQGCTYKQRGPKIKADSKL